MSIPGGALTPERRSTEVLRLAIRFSDPPNFVLFIIKHLTSLHSHIEYECSLNYAGYIGMSCTHIAYLAISRIDIARIVLVLYPYRTVYAYHACTGSGPRG